MALDKVVDSAALDAGMTAVADAIRAKAGTTNTLVWPDGFKAAINGIPGGCASGIYMAQVTPETDLDSIKITHNLGTTDILMAACFAETLGDSVPSFNGTLSKFWAKTDIAVRISSSENGQNFDTHFFYVTSNQHAQGGVPSNSNYRCSIDDENTFSFTKAASSYKYIAGVTYTVIIIAANAEV